MASPLRERGDTRGEGKWDDWRAAGAIQSLPAEIRSADCVEELLSLFEFGHQCRGAATLGDEIRNETWMSPHHGSEDGQGHFGNGQELVGIDVVFGLSKQHQAHFRCLAQLPTLRHQQFEIGISALIIQVSTLQIRLPSPGNIHERECGNQQLSSIRREDEPSVGSREANENISADPRRYWENPLVTFLANTDCVSPAGGWMLC